VYIKVQVNRINGEPAYWSIDEFGSFPFNKFILKRTQGILFHAIEFIKKLQMNVF
jgi:hypothetical protein